MMAIVFSRASEELKDPQLHTKIVVFDIFAFLGVLVNAAVLAPAIFLPRISRSKIWFSLVISWIIYSALYLLLLGRQTGPQPPFGLCIFQAALTTSISLVCIVASACFAIDFTLQVTATMRHGREVNRTVANLIAFFPWIIFLALFSVVLLLAQDPSMVVRDPSELFCSVDSHPLHLITGITLLLSAIVLFPLEIYVAILFHRYSMILPRKNFIDSTTISISTFIRLILFTVLTATGIGIHWYVIGRVNNIVTTCSVILTSLPVLSGLIFGTKKDILQAWMFWKKTTSSDVHYYSPFGIDSRIEELPDIDSKY